MQLLDRLRESVTRRESTEPANSTSPAEAYDILQNERRRRIVSFLATTDSSEVSVATLADHMADEYPGETRNKAYISSIQNHLPAMAKAGLIEYASDRKTISPQPALIDVWSAHQQVQEELR